jgi:hypothetical protein
MVLELPPVSQKSPHGSVMACRIERDFDGRRAVIRLIGHVKAEHLAQLKTMVDQNAPAVAMDLRELNLADVELVRFLGCCEARSVPLLNCPGYIRNWIEMELQASFPGQAGGDDGPDGGN